MKRSVDLHIQGIVQGVGFRPFVYREAKRHLIAGWVLNTNDGVHVHAEGEENLVEAFILALSDCAPSAALVKSIDIVDVPPEGFNDFEIRFSEKETAENTLVSPDMSICDDCRRELFDSANKRYRYPFINCTNCGPRYTIIKSLPYDRNKTCMDKFKMCKFCEGEYTDPLNRRFHAQPVACFDCGPRLELYSRKSRDDCLSACEISKCEVVSVFKYRYAATNRETSDSIIKYVVDRLIDGEIVAVKGLGGYHLVCDANNSHTIEKLRKLKQRDNKAFAVMANDINDVKSFCHISKEEEDILNSPAHPIVLLKKSDIYNLPRCLSFDLPELGVMLPYTPLQALLLNDFAEKSEAECPLLIMTSGNISNEPIVIDDDVACVKFGGIADCILGNNRDILARFDDSVVRVLRLDGGDTACQMIRRARGYAPRPIEVFCGNEKSNCSDSKANYLAVGAEQKNTFTLLNGKTAFVSPHIGDMENAETSDAWNECKDHYSKLFKINKVDGVICDKHPEYLTSKWAKNYCLKSEENIKFTKVQHHHAHIVSAMSENKLAGPVIGFAFDGTGYGMDGAIWGGEVLVSNLTDFERFANFAYVPMPTGAGAIKEPLRMAYGYLSEFDLIEHPALKSFDNRLGLESETLQSLIDEGINCPYTSSMGRMLDSLSAILGICEHPTYEGEASILLEAIAWKASDIDTSNIGTTYSIDILKNSATEHSTAHDTSVLLTDPYPLFKDVLDDIDAGIDACVIAKKIHDCVVECVVQVAQVAENFYGIKTCVLSGGVWQNRYLTEMSANKLSEAGFKVALPVELPPNDACISYGQAVLQYNKDELM